MNQDEAFVQIRCAPTTHITGQPEISLGTPVSVNGANPDGVWAQWSWDGQTLTARNDRLGFYPLYYYLTTDSIALSPSIPQLLALGAPRTLDSEGISVFLRLGFFIGELTPFQAIKALPPGAVLRWSSGTLTIDSTLPKPKPIDISRAEAIRTYAEEFRAAMDRRLPEGRCALPLSGGRDSRHIALELHRRGLRPECVSSYGFPFYRNDDVVVARELAKTLDLPLTVLRQTQPMLSSELVKNVRTNFCADEHGWYMALSDYLRDFDCVYDGIGGDVLSAGLFLDSGALILMQKGLFSATAERMASDSETALSRLLTPAAAERFPRSLAMKSIARELARFADWPNPVGAFYLFNRTRREIALSPYRLIDSRVKVHAPYLDAELFDFLAAIPAERILDKQLHTQTIAHAYPDYADVPYAGSSTDLHPAWWHNATHAIRMLPLVLGRGVDQLVNRRFVWMCLGRTAVDRHYGSEFVHTYGRLAVYLLQLAQLVGEPAPAELSLAPEHAS